VIRKFYKKVRCDQCKLLLVNRSISDLLSQWIFIHTAEGSEHLLGGMGGEGMGHRHVNTKLLIDVLLFSLQSKNLPQRRGFSVE